MQGIFLRAWSPSSQNTSKQSNEQDVSHMSIREGLYSHFLHELSHSHATALNRTKPVVTYRPLHEYGHADGASKQMEQHIRSLSREDVIELALSLHKAISTAVVSHCRLGEATEGEIDFDAPSMRRGSKVHGVEGSELPSLSHYASMIVPETQITNALERGRDEIGLKRVNQYTLLKELGRGRYGKVKLAIDDDENMFAVKVVANQGQPGETLDVDNQLSATLSPMQREVRVMKKLRHRNVIRLREVIEQAEAKNIYLVMDYAERGPLVKMNPNGTCNALFFDTARGYMKQLTDGLQYIHSKNVVHRDIKPDNILLTEAGLVCYSDFGVSSIFDDSQFTAAEGTPSFHSPEMCKGLNYRGPPADVWALGVTFFMIAYGFQPFSSESLSGLRNAIIDDEIAFPELVQGENVSRCSSLVQDQNDETPSKRSSLSGSAENDLLELIEDSPGLSSAAKKQRTLNLDDIGGTLMEHDLFRQLLKGMLEKDPSKRLSISQVRRHPFLRGSGSGEVNQTRVGKLLGSGDVGSMKDPPSEAPSPKPPSSPSRARSFRKHQDS